MRARAIVLAAALAFAPLAVEAADFVVWWEKGYYDQRTRRSGRPSRPSSRKAASRSSSFCMSKRSSRTRSPRRCRLTSRRTSPSACAFPTTRRNGPSTIGLWTSPTPSGSSRICSIRTRSPGMCCSTRRPSKKRSTRCRWGARPTTSTYGRASWSRRGSRSRIFPGSGRRSGRSGATRCSRRCARATGRDDIWGVGIPMSAEASDTSVQFQQFVQAYEADYVTRDGRLVIDDRGAAESSSRQSTATQPFTARAAPRPIQRHGTALPTTRQFLSQAVVMTPNETLSIPMRSSASGPRTTTRTPRRIEWPLGPSGKAFPIMRQLLRGCGLQGRRARRHRQGVRALPRGRGLARALSRFRRRADAAADAEAARCAVLARSERPAPHGRGDADRLQAACTTTT